MNQDAAAAAYYEEIVTISLPRITLMCILSACLLALKHPDSTGESSRVVRNAVRNLTPIVDLYIPDNVLEEWAKVLDTP